MKTRLELHSVIYKTLLIFSIILINVTLTSAQDCEECIHPRVIFYDCDVQTPDTLQNLLVYWFPAAVAKNHIRNNDPSKDCISFYDAGVVNANTLQGGTLKYGAGYANLPPAGPVESAEYIFTSTVRKNGNICTFTLQLETSISREVVKTISLDFTADSLGDVAAGETAANAFIPLFETINNFEVYKRNNFNNVAIRDKVSENPWTEIKLTPAKYKVEADESINIKIQMTDCDGFPLGNREIFFTDTTVDGMNFIASTDGKIEPKVVTTDASGMANVKFTAGKNLGVAEILAFYPHLKPCGRPGGFMGRTVVLVGESPVDQWLVQATFSEIHDRTIDSSSTSNNSSYSFHVGERWEGSATMTGLITVEQYDTSFYFACFEEYECPMENFSVRGSWTENYNKKYWLETSLPFPDADIQHQSYSGHVVPGYSGFQFQYPADKFDVAIVAQCGGVAEGSQSGKFTFCCPFEWINYSPKVSTGFGITAEFNGDQCTTIRTDSGYTVNGSRTYYNSEHTSSGIETITRTITLSATITKNGSITAVENNRNTGVTHFKLNQNYPNPFNPVTVISYQIPFSSFVELKVYDMLGREVKVLVKQQQKAGMHSVTFNGSGLPTGIYFYRIAAGTYSETKKLILMK